MGCVGRLFMLLLLIVIGLFAYCYFTPADEYARARALMKLRQTDAAIEAYEQGIRRFPKSKFTPQARYELGMAYFAKSDYARAAAQLRRALAEDPGNPQAAKAQYTIAVCCLKLGKKQKAMLELAKLRQRYGHIHGLVARAELQLAQLYFDEGDYTNAAKRASWILNNEGDSEFAPAARLLLGDIAWKAKRTENAIKHYQRVSADYPSTREALEAHLKLAKIYQERKEFDKAWQECKDLLRVSGKMGSKMLHDERLKKIVEEAKHLGESLLKL